jgi:tetratricopeptide (TPR) repeat protein
LSLPAPDAAAPTPVADDRHHATVDALIAAAHRWRHDDTRRALSMAHQALTIAEQIDYARGRAWAQLRVALCELIVADPARRYEQRLGESIALMRELADRAGEAEAMNLLAHLLGARGELAAAATLDRRCAALRRDIGDVAGQAGSLNNLGLNLLAQGCSDEALDCLLESLQLSTLVGDVRGMAYAHAGLGALYVSLEQAAAAVGHYELAFAHVARTDDRALECTALTGLARARSLQGAHDASLGLLQHAQTLAQRTGNVGDHARVNVALATVEQARGHPAAAEPHLHAALRLLERAGDCGLEAEVRLQLAISLWSAGRVPDALEALARARALAQATERPALVAQADWLAVAIRGG